MDRIEGGSARALEESVLAVPFFDGEDQDPDHEELVQSVYNMGRDLNDAFDLATYSDLVSTGRLRLIEDAELRAAIQRAYATIGRVEAMRRPNREQFQQEVRGWIPQRVVDSLRADCEGMSEPDWTCPDPDFGQDVARRISSRWASDAAVVAFRLRVQGLSGLIGTIEGSAQDVEAALEMLGGI